MYMTDSKPPKDSIHLWNARGITDEHGIKRAFLADFINRWQPLAVGITESKLSPDASLRLAENIKYHEFRQNNTARSSGVALLVNRALHARHLTDLSLHSVAGNTATDLLTVEITNPKVDASGQLLAPPTVVAVAYIRPDAPDTQQLTLTAAISRLTQHCERTNRKLLLMGDFNTHDTRLGANKTDKANGLVADLLAAPPLHCANVTFKTGPTHDKGGVLDLILSSDPTLVTSLRISKEEMCDFSDHFVVTATADLAAPPLAVPFEPRWNLRKADWPAYTIASDDAAIVARNRGETWNAPALNTEWIQADYSNAVAQRMANELATSLTRQINEAASLTIPRTARPPGVPAGPKITKETAQLIAERRRVARHLQRAGTSPQRGTGSLKRKLKSLRDTIRANIQKEQRRVWAERCDSIEEPDGIHIRRVNYAQFDRTIAKPNVTPSEIADEKGIRPGSIKESLNNFARFQSQTVHATPPGDIKTDADRRFSKQVRRTIEKAAHQPIAFEFQMDTLLHVLKSVSNTAAGDDGIHNSMLRHAGPALCENILALINFCHLSGTVPTQWKTVKTIALFKSGSTHDPSNFRTIALNPTLLKVMETVVLHRLQSIIKDESLADTQFGFRHRRSTGDALFYVTQRIRQSFKNHKKRCQFLPVAFIDISKAFDRVRPAHVLGKLNERGVPPDTLRWLSAYLTNRSFYVSSLGERSNPAPAENGTPQGAILSPFLFLVFIDEIKKRCSKHGVDAVMFADDIALLPKMDGSPAFGALQSALDELSEWATATHTAFNVKSSKSAAMIFTQLHGDDAPPPRPLTLSGRTLEYDATYKYLGVVLDPALKWLEQATAAIRKAVGTSHQITRIVHSTRNFSVHCVATLVRTILVPRCLYASQYWKPTAIQLAKILTAIVVPLKRALGLPWNFHSLSVLVECDVLTPNRYINLYTTNTITRALRDPAANPTATKLASQTRSAVSDFKHGITRHSISAPPDVLARGALMIGAMYEFEKNDAHKQVLKSEQIAELNAAHWGSSLRYANGSDYQTMSALPYIKLDSLETARVRSDFRFDTFSQWRRFKQKKIASPQCRHCSAPEARSTHLLTCPGLRAIRARHMWALNRLRRTIRCAYAKRNRRHPLLTRTLLAGYDNLLSSAENSELHRASAALLWDIRKATIRYDQYSSRNVADRVED